MEFTNEQQKEVDRLIEEAVNKINTEKTQEIEKLKTELESKSGVSEKEFARRLNNEVEKKLAERAENNQETKGDDKTSELLQSLEETNSRIARLEQEKNALAIEKCAIENNVQPNAVKLLTIHVQNELAKEDPESVDDIIKKFTEENPYVIKQEKNMNTGIEQKGNAKNATNAYKDALAGKK